MEEHPDLEWSETRHYKNEFRRHIAPRQFNLDRRTLEEIPMSSIETTKYIQDKKQQILEIKPKYIVGSKGYICIAYAKIDSKIGTGFLVNHLNIYKDGVEVDSRDNKNPVNFFSKFKEGRLAVRSSIIDYPNTTEYVVSTDANLFNRVVINTKGFAFTNGTRIIYYTLEDGKKIRHDLGPRLYSDSYFLAEDYLVYPETDFSEDDTDESDEKVQKVSYINTVALSDGSEDMFEIKGRILRVNVSGNKVYYCKKGRRGYLYILNLITRASRGIKLTKHGFPTIQMVSKDGRYLLVLVSYAGKSSYYLLDTVKETWVKIDNDDRCVGMNEEGTLLYMVDEDNHTVRTYTMEPTE